MTELATELPRAGHRGCRWADSTSANLNDLVASSAKDMQNQLERIRIAASHVGLKGAGAEEILAQFLHERLPIRTGQVVDRDGKLSKQADVVIYDATRETSAAELTDIGCRYVILGHSERRRYLGETNIMTTESTAFRVKSRGHLNLADLATAVNPLYSPTTTTRSS